MLNRFLHGLEWFNYLGSFGLSKYWLHFELSVEAAAAAAATRPSHRRQNRNMPDLFLYTRRHTRNSWNLIKLECFRCLAIEEWLVSISVYAEWAGAPIIYLLLPLKSWQYTSRVCARERAFSVQLIGRPTNSKIGSLLPRTAAMNRQFA